MTQKEKELKLMRALRNYGYTYQRIAEIVGLPKSTVYFRLREKPILSKDTNPGCYKEKLVINGRERTLIRTEGIF